MRALQGQEAIPQALPLAALCRTIEINLLQAIDVEDLPEMLEPERSILL